MQDLSAKNIKDSFSQKLINRILSGQLKPGDRLAPERELALENGISRGSVNQAILDMERMGFLHIVPRKGTYVAEYMSNATPETLSAVMSYDSDAVDSSLFRDLMQFRILVECECTRLSCRRVNSEISRGLGERMDAMFAAGDNIASAVYEFHRYIVYNSGNAAYTMVFRSFEKMLRSMIQLHHSNIHESGKSIGLYARIASAISRADADEAESLMRRLLTQASEYLDNILREREK